MRRLNKQVQTVCAVIFIACMSSCSNTSPPVSTAPTQGAPASGATAPTSSAAPQMTLTVYVNLDEGNMQTFPNPDAALIEKQVRALNWQNPALRPYVHLSRIDATSGSYLKLQGTQGTPNTDGLFRAVGRGLAGAGWIGESPPLESIDAGLSLMLQFLNDPEGLKTAVRDWKTESTQ